MNTKRISLVLIVLGLFFITGCGPHQPAITISMEVIKEPQTGTETPQVSEVSGVFESQSVITRENAHALTQVQYLGKGNINDIAWSPTGSSLALATATGIYLIDPQTYQEVHFTKTASNNIAFSTDGTCLAYPEGSHLILHDLSIVSEPRVFEGHAEIYSVAFSPTENLLAAASQDGAIIVWDMASGEELASLEKPGTFLHGLAFSYDGQILVSVAYSLESDHSEITLWDVDNAAEVLPETKIEGTTLALSPTGETIAAGSYDEPLRLLDFNGQVHLTLDEEPKPVIDLAFSPDGKVLASATMDTQGEMWLNTSLKLWNTTSGEILHTLVEDGEYNRISFSPDGTQLAAATPNKAKLWDIESGQEIATLTDQTDDSEKQGYGKGGVNDFAWSPDGETLALANFSGVTLVNRYTYEEILFSKGGNQPQIGHIINFSPDGKLLAASYVGEGVKIFDIESQELLLTLNDFEDMVPFGIVFSPDNSKLAIGWGNPWGIGSGSVKIWDLSTGAVDQEFGYEDHETIYNLTFNQEGDLLAAISGIGQVHLWNVAEGTEVMTLTGTSGYGYAVAFSPDGKLLAAGGGASDGHSYDYEEAELRLFDLRSGELVTELEGHQAILRSLDFNANGGVLASASFDGTVRLWDAQTGQQLAVLDVPDATSVAFSPDGTLLATAGGGDVLRIWGVLEP